MEENFEDSTALGSTLLTFIVPPKNSLSKLMANITILTKAKRMMKRGLNIFSLKVYLQSGLRIVRCLIDRRRCCRILRRCLGVVVHHPPPRNRDYIPHDYRSAYPSFLGDLGGGELVTCLFCVLIESACCPLRNASPYKLSSLQK